MSLLETAELSKSFGSIQAVDSVTFEFDGENLEAIIGPNGAGKTTFFNLITGHLEPSSGEIYFKGESIVGMEEHEINRRGIAKSFQIPSVFPELSVFENVRLAVHAERGGRRSLLAPKDGDEGIRARTNEIIDLLGLEESADTTASMLPHGDLRKLDLGIALASDPDLLLMDEPTSGLSSGEFEKIEQLITDLLSEHSIVLIDHNMDFVMSIADHISVLYQGSIIAQGTAEDIRQSQRVNDVYLQS